jgi:hypothetical protein
LSSGIRIKNKNSKKKIEIQASKSILIQNEIESSEVLELELNMQKDILKNEKKRTNFKEKS